MGIVLKTVKHTSLLLNKMWLLYKASQWIYIIYDALFVVYEQHILINIYCRYCCWHSDRAYCDVSIFKSTSLIKPSLNYWLDFSELFIILGENVVWCLIQIQSIQSVWFLVLVGEKCGSLSLDKLFEWVYK